VRLVICPESSLRGPHASPELDAHTLATLFPSLSQAIQDLNVGIVALAVNIAVLLAASALTRAARSGAHAEAPHERA